MCATSAAAQSAGSNTPADSLTGTDTVKAFIAARVQKTWTPPKTPWGDPDIQGVFTNKDEANTPMERPAEWAGRKMDDITPQEFAAAVARRQERAVETAPFAGGGEQEAGVALAVPIHWFDNLAAKNSRPWFVIDPTEGTIPALTPQAQASPRPQFLSGGLRGGGADSYLDRSLGDRCVVFGMLRTPIIYGNSYQIVQGRDNIVLRYEMLHDARIIPIEGRGAPARAGIPNAMGESRARWDGNTLVVETTNFEERMLYFNLTAGRPTATSMKNMRVIERFTRIAPNKVEWTVTLDDASTWNRPWTYSIPLTEDNSQLIFEYACHEGNYGLANILSAGRALEKAGRSYR
jgi:hypothetical protein